MSLHKAKPTSAGRRFVVQVKTAELHKGKPYAPLLDKKMSKGGRNNNGRITVRHQGGGHKQRYRIIDFKRNKDGVPGVVERLEYDPNRSAHIALIKYADGERRYILAPKGVSAGTPIMSGDEAPIKPGNALPIRQIPVGSVIPNIEMKPGKGGQLVRSAALARLHLNVMNRRTDRNRAQRQSVARLDRRIFSADDLCAGAQAFGRENVATLAVSVLDQRDVSAAVRVIREALNNAWYAVLVTLEVNDAVALLVPTALVAHRDAAVVVAAAFRHLLVEKGRVRLALVQFRGLDLDDESTSRRCRLCFMQ